jgi:hypothetical protein
MPSQSAPRDLTDPDRHTLSHPALTGMPRQQLENLTTELAAAQAAQREQQRHIRRGSERRRAPGAGPPPKLTPADRVLATVLYLRRSFPQPLLAQLFGVHRSQITRAIAETQKLLDHHDHTAIASTARFHTPTDIVGFIANVEATKIKPAS